MNKTYYGIIQLIKSAVTEKSIQLPDDFDWKCAVEIAKLHKIEALVYYGAYYSKIDIPNEPESTLKKRVFAESMLDAQQTHEIFTLCKELGDRKIAYLPLKGVILKKYYPKPEMRYMSDADILIKEEEYPQIEKIMIELGYTFKVESNHEYVWNKGNVSIELHKRLIPSYNEDYYKYYGDGWKLAKLNDGTQYFMTDEDFLIYMVTHLAKHYRDSGIGIKHFVDIWVYINQKNNLDKKYIETELKKLQLFEFYEHCIQLLGVWFEGKAENNITELMTQCIFSSGVYGNTTNNNISSALKEERKNGKSARLKFYIETVFLPYDKMCIKYSWLNRIPVLLPVMWIVRIITALFIKQNKVKNEAFKGSVMTKRNINEYEQSLGAVGLKFDFKEKKE